MKLGTAALGEPGHGVPLASFLTAGRLKAIFAVE
jgi:hypothetical protein